MIRVLLLFTLPQEYGCLKRLMGSWRPATQKPFKSFAWRDSAKELVLIETGMGRDRMIEALEWQLERCHPDLVIVAGFAGSLSRELAVGDVCLGETFVSLDVPSPCDTGERSELEISPGLAQFCSEHGIRRLQILTVGQPPQKELLSEQYSGNISVVDMESYFAGRFCFERNLPFVAFRSISDGLLDEIDFDLTSITDARGQVKVPLVLLSILGNPSLLRSYYLSWKRSTKAAKNLGKVIFELLRLSPAKVRSLIP